MESVAPPGGVMLSESTARLVEHATVLADRRVHVKGAEDHYPRVGCWAPLLHTSSAGEPTHWSGAPGR